MNKKFNLILILSIITHNFSLPTDTDSNSPWLGAGLFTATVILTTAPKYIKNNEFTKKSDLDPSVKRSIKKAQTDQTQATLDLLAERKSERGSRSYILPDFTGTSHHRSTSNSRPIAPLPFSGEEEPEVPIAATPPIPRSESSSSVSVSISEGSSSSSSRSTSPTQTPSGENLTEIDNRTTFVPISPSEERRDSVIISLESDDTSNPESISVNISPASRRITNPTQTPSGRSERLAISNRSLEFGLLGKSLTKILKMPESSDSKENKNPNKKDQDNNTKLYDSLCFGRNTEFEELINLKNINLNIKHDKEENTLLHKAVEFNNLDAVKKLLKAGANANIKNTLNKTPLDVAKQMNRAEIIKLLDRKPLIHRFMNLFF